MSIILWPWRHNLPIITLCPGGNHSLNMRPLWGRSLFNHYIDHSFWNNNNFYDR